MDSNLCYTDDNMTDINWLITGGTGSLGSHLVPFIVENLAPESVTVFSRNEYEQYAMQQRVPEARYCIGDVRDKEALWRACGHRFPDRIVHAAALKHIRTAEEQPEEAMLTNVIGTQNVTEIATELGASMVLISTDKAVHPTNVYGATKMVAERIVRNAGQCVVRYGNVFGSRGSVLHRFGEIAKAGGVFPIHDKRMTRFVITFREAIKTILYALSSPWEQLVIPELPAIRIVDLAMAFGATEIEEIGIQPGEKLAEELSPGVTSDMARMLTVREIKQLIEEERRERV